MSKTIFKLALLSDDDCDFTFFTNLCQNLPDLDISLRFISPQTRLDIDEINCKIKLICYAKRNENKIYATVKPMMVKNDNFLSGVNGATNAVRLINRYSGKHILIGSGAGSLETASSIVADIIFIARY